MAGTDVAVLDEQNQGMSIIEGEAGVVSSVAIVREELRAALVVAHQFPRNEGMAYQKLIGSMARPTMAEKAMYAYPRGGTTIEGPSIGLAREAARAWGNMRYGHRIVSQDDDTCHIKGFALDLETNNYVEHEDKFNKLVQRKQGGKTSWVKPDERDLRELINRRGALCVRAALLQLMPPYMIEDALNEAKKTSAAVLNGSLKADKDTVLRSVLKNFNKFGVTAEMIEGYLGHDLQAVNADEVRELNGVLSSIAEGHTRREDHFELPQSGTTREKGTIDLDKMKAGKPKGKPTPGITPAQSEKLLSYMPHNELVDLATTCGFNIGQVSDLTAEQADEMIKKSEAKRGDEIDLN